jgi:hypothetical protein
MGPPPLRARSDKWEPVIGSNARKNKERERRSESVRSEHALVDGEHYLVETAVGLMRAALALAILFPRSAALATASGAALDAPRRAAGRTHFGPPRHPSRFAEAAARRAALSARLPDRRTAFLAG